MVEITEKEKQVSPKEQCQINGGFWDEETQTCLPSKPLGTDNEFGKTGNAADQRGKDEFFKPAELTTDPAKPPVPTPPTTSPNVVNPFVFDKQEDVSVKTEVEGRSPLTKLIRDKDGNVIGGVRDGKPVSLENGGLEASEGEGVFRNKEGNLSGITQEGRTFLGLSPDEVRETAARQQAQRLTPEGTMEQGQLSAQAQSQRDAIQLAGLVGDFDQTTGLSPTGLDVGEAVTTGIIGAIPRALSLAATGAGIGFVGGGAATGGVGAVPAAIIGGVAGFVGGLASSMIGNFKSQRSDTTTAQQRILDEGKQTLKDWSTLAKADPSNKEFYLGQFNLQLQQIQEANRQMLIDTNADVSKFETALPNLAEFNAFYSIGGERDALVKEMEIALQTPSTTEFDIVDLANRRGAK